MKGKFSGLIAGLLLLLAANASAQNGGNINGPTTVTPGATEFYSAYFDGTLSPAANVTWTVYGGTIVSEANNPTGSLWCYVQWDNDNGQGWVDIYEDVGGQWGMLTVFRGPPFSPGLIGTNGYWYNYAAPIAIVSHNPASGGGCTFTYNWEYSIDGIINWNYFGSGINYPTGLPPNLERVFIRRGAECNGQTAYTDPLEFRYRSASWDNRNFISTNQVWYSGKLNYISADNLPIGQKQQSVVYYDGLGRPEQSVVVGASAETGNPATSKKDLVTPIVYDALGREVKKYLAYQAGTADGKFKLNASDAQLSYMNAKYPGETPHFALTDLESSPVNRLKKIKAPGANWGGANKGISTDYDRNKTTDEVRIWKIDAFTAAALPTSGVADLYPAFSLTKTITTDERDKKIIEYRDNNDRVILRKQQFENAPNLTEGHGGWLCTYYVYDDFGRMRYMITPKAVQQLPAAGWVLSQAMADGLCYKYVFDGRGRLIEKKLPDADPMYYVYDNRDRLVFSQDGSQKLGKTNPQNYAEWTFYLYDVQNRGVAVGNMRDNAGTHTRASLQAVVDNPTYILGEKTFNIQLDQSEPITAFNPVPLFSANGPTIAFFDVKINVVTHFDGLTANQFVAETMGYASNFENIDEAGASNRTRGLQTGTRARVLNAFGGSTFSNSYTIYDQKGRVLQTNSYHLSEPSTRMTNQYDFSGKVRSTLYKHEKIVHLTWSPVHHYTTETYTILSKYEHDHVGRSKQVKKNITRSFHTTQATDQPNPLVTTTGERAVVENKFDELGQLQTKTLAPGYSGPNGSWLEKLDYEYNIRGWITGINKSYVSNSSGSGSFFGMELGYDKAGTAGFTNTILNGNVAGMAWKTAGDNTPRKFDYAYDNANRITSATFKQRPDFVTWSNTLVNFSMPVVSYDFNGNITRLEQAGMNFTGIVANLDALTYGYSNTSNKLNWVAEDANVDRKLNDFTDKNPGANNVDYAYDPNGNLTEDKNKGITSIKYNYLNLPELITFDNNRGTISYAYDAAGNKVQKVVTDNTPTTGQVITTTSYYGPIVQTGPEVSISFEEGRVRFAKKVVPSATPAFTFDYFIKDHLGNVRMVLTEDEQSDQYPSATMETATQALEDKFYRIVNRTDKPPALQGNPAYDQRYGQKMSLLSSSGNKIGPSILLKVMSGDLVRAKTDYYYQANGAQVNTNTLLNDLAANLLIHLNAGQAGHTAKSQSATINTSVLSDAMVQGLISTQNSNYDPNRPKAHLNYIVFDEQFKAVQRGSMQVQANGPLQNALTPPDVTIAKNGWIYVFVNNESQQSVYFDNFQVTHERGNILEETHYYPFGLTMKMISPRALSVTPPNRLKYNGKELQNEEFSDGSGLEGYDFGARVYDAQTGRWHGIDPQAEDFPNVSPYSYAVNNPTLHIDKDGKFVHLILQYGINVGINVAVQMLTAYMFDPKVKSWGDAWDKVSMWDAIWEGATDMIGSKSLRMAANGVKGIFGYIDDVGFSNITASGLISSGLMGILEPIVGDALGKYGIKAVQRGLHKLGLDGSTINRLLGIPDPKPVKVDLKADKNFSMKKGDASKYSPSNYRQNLALLTGIDPANSSAHHIFPQAERFKKFFENAKIDNMDPINMQWWNNDTHFKKAKEYNAKWDFFMKNNPNASTKDIMDFGRNLMASYGMSVFF